MRLLWIFLLVMALGRTAQAQSQMINGIAVIVNNAVITYQDVRVFVGAQLDLLERQFGDQPQVLGPRKARLLKDGTDQLVERQLILHDFKTAGYNLPESIIEDTIRDRIKQRFGDRVTLAKTLKAEGVTFETYRQRTREEIVIEQMRYFHVSKDLIVSPQKIANYYEAQRTNYTVADQVKLRMIVLNKPVGGSGTATLDLAREILGKIKGGASFEEMARIHSEGSQRTVGGDWGWVERKVLRAELAEIAFKQPKGTLTDVVDLPEACFLMLVEDVRSSHVKPLAEVRDEIEKNLLAQERARLQAKWVDRLKSKSFIRYFL